MIVLRTIVSSEIATKRKDRLVAQEFSQRPRVHFNETFAPVSRLSTIRTVAALAVRCI